MSEPIIPPELVNDPTEKTCAIGCTTRFFDKNISETVAGHTNRYVSKMAFLIPEGGQREAFLSAWLPEVVSSWRPGQVDEKVCYELAGYIKPPIDSPCRFAIFRGGDGRCEKHYLMVMSTGVAEIIRKMPEGVKLQVDIFPASGEEVADQSRESSGSYDLIDGDKELKW